VTARAEHLARALELDSLQESERCFHLRNFPSACEFSCPFGFQPAIISRPLEKPPSRPSLFGRDALLRASAAGLERTDHSRLNRHPGGLRPCHRRRRGNGFRGPVRRVPTVAETEVRAVSSGQKT
jgi:hypothetical protein